MAQLVAWVCLDGSSSSSPVWQRMRAICPFRMCACVGKFRLSLRLRQRDWWRPDFRFRFGLGRLFWRMQWKGHRLTEGLTEDDIWKRRSALFVKQDGGRLTFGLSVKAPDKFLGLGPGWIADVVNLFLQKIAWLVTALRLVGGRSWLIKAGEKPRKRRFMLRTDSSTLGPVWSKAQTKGPALVKRTMQDWGQADLHEISEPEEEDATAPSRGSAIFMMLGRKMGYLPILIPASWQQH
eukprot:965896-Amphidinium_carterae.3